MKKMNKAFAFLAGAALAFGGLFIGCSEDNGALNDPEKIIEDANETATKDAEAADKGETTEDSGDKGTTDKGGSGAGYLSGTWTALDYVTSTAYADKLALKDGEKLGDVVVSGTGANWRGKKDSSDTTKFIDWSHLELGKAAKGCLSFKIEKASKIVVSAASTGKNNTSDIWLGTAADGTTGTVAGSATTVTGSDYTDVTYASVPAGTYYLGAFPGADRGVRIKKITVTATTSGSTPSTPATGGTGTTTTGSGDTGNTGDDTTTGDGGKGSSVNQKATAATYSFAADTGDGTGIVLKDLTGFDVSSDNVFGVPSSTDIATTELANGATLFYKGSKQGTLRFRCKNTADTAITETSAKTITAINYNGGASDDLSDGTTLSNIDRGIMIEVDGAGTVTATVTFKGSSDESATGTLQAAFVDENGTLLGNVTEDPIKSSSSKTVTAKTTEATTVYLVFSRNGAKYTKNNKETGTGGLDVTKIEVAPAN